MFLEIASSGELRKILISGEASDDECQEVWEKIIEQHNYHNGNQEHFNYITHLKAYKELLNRYNTIKSSLMTLLFALDNPTIEYLNLQGYKIDTTNQEKFEQSLKAAFIKSDNLNSKLKMKLNQIQNFNENLMEKRRHFEQNHTGLEERLAGLSFELGFSVDENITLARYNEYVKIINKQNGSRKKRHNNG